MTTAEWDVMEDTTLWSGTTSKMSELFLEICMKKMDIANHTQSLLVTMETTLLPKELTPLPAATNVPPATLNLPTEKTSTTPKVPELLLIST